MRSLAVRHGVEYRTDPLRLAAFVLFVALSVSAIRARNVADAVGALLPFAIALAGYLCATHRTLEIRVLENLWMPVLCAVTMICVAFGAGQRIWIGPWDTVSVFGNRNTFGTFAALVAPLGLGLLLGRPERRHQWVGAVTLAVALLGVFVSDSRGAAIAAAAGCGVALLGLRRRMSHQRILGAGAVLLTLVVAGVATGRLKTAFDPHYETNVVRREIWKGTLRLILRNPLMGVGAGAYEERFPPFRSRKEFALSHRGKEENFVSVPDAHNIFLHLAAESGLPALSAFLWFLYVACRRWLYFTRTQTDDLRLALVAGCGGGGIAFLVAGLFSTATLWPFHLLFFFLLLGISERLGNLHPKVRLLPVRERAWVLSGLALIACLFALGMTVLDAVAQRNYYRSLRTDSTQDRVERLQSVVCFRESDWRAWHELGRSYNAEGRRAEAEAAYAAAIRWNPNHAPSLVNWGILLAREASQASEAESKFRGAIQIAPAWFLSHYNLGMLHVMRREIVLARSEFEEARCLYPGYGPAYYFTGETYLAEGDIDSAIAWYREARRYGVDSVEQFRKDHPDLANDPRFRPILQ